MMGIPALLSHRIFCLHKRFRFRLSETIFGVVAGASGVFLSTLILTALLVTTGSEFIGVAKYAALAHLPVIIIEGIITGFVVSFLTKIKPEIVR